jgi:amino acid transporter
MIVKHQMGLFSAVAISVTSMVGSGWLFSAQLNAKFAGNYSFIAWLIAAGIVSLVGLCFAKICTMYPQRGINVKCTSLSHGKDFGLIFAFCFWFGVLAMIPNESQATVQYLSPFIHFTNLYDGNGLTITGKLFSVLILFIYLLINFFGIKLLSYINNVATVFKISIPILTIIVLMVSHFDSSNFSLNVNNYTSSNIKTALIGAGLIYTFNGFQIITSFASEIKNPSKTIPLAIMISIGITLFLYLLLQLSFMGAMPHSVAEKGWVLLNFTSPLVNLTILLGLNYLAILLIADSVVSPSITGLSYLGSCSRMLYAMADKGQMPKWIAKLCPVRHISKRSLAINFIISCVILFNSKGWAELMIITTTFNILGYMGAPLSLAIFHKGKISTKILTFLVFIILSLLLTTLPSKDFLLSNIVISCIVIMYALLQWLYSKYNIYSIIFLVFLWILMIVSNSLIGSIILSTCFFIVVTSNIFIEQFLKFIPDED